MIIYCRAEAVDMETENNTTIPTISIKCLSNYISGKLPCESFDQDKQVRILANQITDAFIEWGFVYLIDHGIEQKIIDDASSTSKEFFTSSKSLKEQFLRETDGENWGYVPFNVETFEKTRPFDLKECFNFSPNSKHLKLMNDTFPAYMPAQTKLFNACIGLSKYVLKLLNLTLPVHDVTCLESNHKHLGNLDGNVSITRLLYYPSIENEENVLKNQLRCGEHSDYGTITFLFQDEKGGLQVVNPDGKYIDVTPIPGSIIVNTGDLLEIWTAGRFKATKHRVVVPAKLNEPRQSIAFFVHPDSDVNVSCLDGSDTYPTENSLQYLLKKYAETY